MTQAPKSIDEDFKQATEIMERIEKKYDQAQNRGLLFVLCLIYTRLVNFSE